ncbi:MAG TPA: septal ring lytic transglycosylase RlpA family protein [Thermoanaerobaculia bacterium]|nr:septal ring lytic transglycosylase RlpA family protein [Thermoanaerobaculia bacterium]
MRTEGLASWYGQEFAGRTTANGEIFDPEILTAAHRTLPFGTLVRVTNVRSGGSVVVRINDRGPFIESRIIDLSYAAAKEIDMVEIGITPVRIEVVRLASEGEPPAPYVVRVEDPADKLPIPEIPESPPLVDFPLPDSAGSREAPVRPRVESGDVVVVEVIEETPSGTRAERQVDETGRRIVTAPPPPSQGNFFIQIGAFSIEENARKLASEARSIDDRVFVTRTAGLWRVRVGPVDSRVRAIELRERFDSAGYPSLIVDGGSR